MALAQSGLNIRDPQQAYDQRRRTERRACNLQAVIVTRHGEISGRIYNLSAGGAGISIDPVVSLRPGESFVLRHDVLGEIPCIVRWAVHPRFGAEFTVAGAALASVHAVYDRLSADPGGEV